MIRARISLAATALSLLLGSCSSQPDQHPPPAPHATVGGLLAATSVAIGPRQPTRMSEPERQACFAAGGKLVTMGFSGNEGCARPMPDAGKACTDGSQCQGGTCTLDDRQPGFKPPRANERVTGQCAATDYGFGCAWRISDGDAVDLCVD